MFNSTILEVVIGLVFLYLLFSLLATFVNELIFTFFRFRANHLKKAIQNMMDNDAEEGKVFFDKFYQHPLIQSFLRKKGKGFPSYIDPKKFASVVFEIYSEEKISKGKDALKKKIENLPEHSHLRHLLLKYIEQSEDKAQELEKKLEDWFNGSMERASGWYNRNIKKWTIAIAVVIAILFNFDSINVYKQLTTDSNVRQDLVKYAEGSIDKYAELVNIDTTVDAADNLYVQKLDSLKTQINSILDEEIASIESMAGIGWEKETPDEIFHTFWDFILKVCGWIITALAISLGAPFWFDLLNKVMKLRGTGKQEELPKNPIA